MKALLFAAGRGERMRPLTDATPKPLLRVGGRMLIEHHLEKFAAAGIRAVVINTSYLADQFPAALGDGARWHVRIHYSNEGPDALETGGGMLHALQLLGSAPFLAVNADIFTDFDFAMLPREPAGVAEVVLVDSPTQHPDGDFGIDPDDKLLPTPDIDNAIRALTFAGVGVYRPQILDGWRAIIGATPGAHATPPRFPLGPLLRVAIGRDLVAWRHHRGCWTDVGTPDRLAAVDAQLQKKLSTRINADQRG